MANTLTRIFASTLAVAAGAHTLFAVADDHTWEAHIGLGQVFFGNALDDTQVLNLGVGYRIDPSWTVEVLFSDLSTDIENTSVGVDGRQFRVDAHYHLGSLYGVEDLGSWRPFLVAGLGQQKLTPATGNSSSEVMFNYGVGVKRQVANDWDVRGDFRGFYSLDENYTDFALSVGVSYRFGARWARTPAPVSELAPVPAPVLTPAPVVEPEIEEEAVVEDEELMVEDDEAILEDHDHETLESDDAALESDDEPALEEDEALLESDEEFVVEEVALLDSENDALTESEESLESEEEEAFEGDETEEQETEADSEDDNSVELGDE